MVRLAVSDTVSRIPSKVQDQDAVGSDAKRPFIREVHLVSAHLELK